MSRQEKLSRMVKTTALKLSQAQMTGEAEKSARSRLEARRRAFLDAANAAFLEKGYANTTLGDIIARSGGSRQTLYMLFGGKQGLFEAIVSDFNADVFRPFRAADDPERTPDEVLVEIGTHFLHTVLAPNAVALFRLVVAEGPFMGELSERFWSLGPARTLAAFESYFLEQTRRGVLVLSDAHQAARQFQGMLLGTFHIQCLLGLRSIPAPAEIDDFVRAAVKKFLDGSRKLTR